MDMKDEKKKSIAAVIVAKMKPRMGDKMAEDEGETGEEEESSDDSSGKMEAARELMEAVASRDAQGVKDAMQSFVDMCMSEE